MTLIYIILYIQSKKMKYKKTNILIDLIENIELKLLIKKNYRFFFKKKKSI